MMPSTTPTPSTSSTPSSPSQLRLPPPQIIVPLLAVTAYSAFLITGFDTPLGMQLQPLPLYLFFCILLLLLQLVISRARARSLFDRILTFIFSIAALVYAGEVMFQGQNLSNFTHQPLTYVLINAALFIVFLADTAIRWVLRVVHRTPRDPARPRLPDAEDAIAFWGNIAADCFGLAILAGISALALTILQQRWYPTTLKPQNPIIYQPYVMVDLHTVIGVNLGYLNPLNYLDLWIALIPLFLGMVVMVFIALSVGEEASPPNKQKGGEKFLVNMRRIGGKAIDEMLFSLRLVVTSFIWLLPAFFIAAFSQNYTGYLILAANCFHRGCRGHSGIMLFFEMFVPYNAVPGSFVPDLGTFLPTLLFLVLGVVAVLAVIAAVAFAEHNTVAFPFSLLVLKQTGQGAALAVAIFLYSLALFNAIIYIPTESLPLPFQVGPAGGVALVVFIIWLLVDRSRPSAPPK